MSRVEAMAPWLSRSDISYPGPPCLMRHRTDLLRKHSHAATARSMDGVLPPATSRYEIWHVISRGIENMNPVALKNTAMMMDATGSKL